MGVGGFLGIGDKDVAIPMDELELQDTQIVMRGETEDSLLRLPDYDSNDYRALDSARRPIDFVQ